MTDSFGRIIALIIAAFLLIFLPYRCIQSIEERSQKEYIESCLRKIYREVRQEGGWTGEIYHHLVHLAGTGNRRMQIEVVISRRRNILQSEESNKLFDYYQQEFINDLLIALEDGDYLPVSTEDTLSIRLLRLDGERYVYGGTGEGI